MGKALSSFSGFAPLRFLFLDFFPGLASAASSGVFVPSRLFTCQPRAIPNASAGAFSVIGTCRDIRAIPIRTGAISANRFR